MNKIDKIIGLDIGASKIGGIVFDGKRIVDNLTVQTPKNLKTFKQSIKKLIVELSPRNIACVGVGFPGAAGERGKVAYAPNMKYLEGFNLLKFFKSLGFRRTVIENDANCFALAEAQVGQGRKFKNFIGITLGTGIGGGLMSNARIYSGAHGSAGEVGHMTAGSGEDYEKVFQKLRNKKNYAQMGKLLGRLFADVYNFLDVEAVILGGSVSKSASRFLPRAIKEARKKILNKRVKPVVLVSKLKYAGALGAALLVK